MAAVIAVLGAGPHGREIAGLLRASGKEVSIFDDAFGDPIEAAGSCEFIAGAVWPNVRRQIAGRARGRPYLRGSVTFPGACLSESALVGSHVHIGYNAVVSHGCRLGDFVTICSGAVLAGEVLVGDDVFIGANATVIHGGITIGQGAFVGAGAVVLSDVPPGAVVAGVPARILQPSLP